MRVLELEVSQFMKISAAHIVPKGQVIEIAGKNGAGKSTLLNAIKAAIGGGKLPEQAVRKGEKESVIRVKLGEDKPTLIVTRTISATEDGGQTTHLDLEGPNGELFKRPQEKLNALYGALTFDPFEFTRMDSDDQLETLRGFVPSIDFEAINAANDGDRARRTDVNRQARQARARLATMAIPGDPRHERVDETALVAELEKAGQAATAIERERAARQDRMREIKRLQTEGQRLREDNARRRDEIQELREQIETLESRIATGEATATKCDEAAARAQSEVEALPELAIAPDTTDIRKRMETARTRNLQIDERERALKERERIEAEAVAAEKQVAEYTARIDAREKQKADAVAAAKLPIVGLGFADDGVLYNGLPFEQASTGERLKVSFAIAAAMSPELKIAGVRDASLLDQDTRAQVEQLAEEYDVQCWLEVMKASSAAAIVLEDGRVKASADEAAA